MGPTGLLELLAATEAPVFVIDDAARIVRWSPGAGLLFGMREDEVRGRRYEEVFGWAEDEGYDDVWSSSARTLELGERPVQARVRSRTGPLDASFFPVTVGREARPGWRAFLVATPTTEPEPEAASTDRGTPLTPRQMSVLRLLAQGHGTDEIARRLTISPTTVCNHIQRILDRLDVHSRLEAVALALREGWLPR